MQIREFARIAQIYAVRVSEFVRKNNWSVFTALVLVSPLDAPEAARIVFDCRTANDAASISCELANMV